MMEFNIAYPGQNIMNFYYAYQPYFFHPFMKSSQMAVVILTVILSMDRYVVVFYPYLIYR